MRSKPLKKNTTHRQKMVNVSRFSDFCFGVKRAIYMAENALDDTGQNAYSIGPIIHNRRVVERLARKGLRVVKNIADIESGRVVIRSHGATPDVLRQIRKRRIQIVDATCPFVKNAQRIAAKLAKEGYSLVIVGDRDHPEVRSIKSYSNARTAIVADRKDARDLKGIGVRVGIIAQTTQSPADFAEVVAEILAKNFTEVRVFNTICRDARMRQESTKKCSAENDLVIVVGGKNSANTRRLYDICRDCGTDARHIEHAGQIRPAWIRGRKSIGIVGGASTPRWIVDEVVERLRDIFNQIVSQKHKSVPRQCSLKGR